MPEAQFPAAGERYTAAGIAITSEAAASTPDPSMPNSPPAALRKPRPQPCSAEKRTTSSRTMEMILASRRLSIQLFNESLLLLLLQVTLSPLHYYLPACFRASSMKVLVVSVTLHFPRLTPRKTTSTLSSAAEPFTSRLGVVMVKVPSPPEV